MIKFSPQKEKTIQTAIGATVMIFPIEIPFDMESSVIFNIVVLFIPSKLTLLV